MFSSRALRRLSSSTPDMPGISMSDRTRAGYGGSDASANASAALTAARQSWVRQDK
jgi:hypothetical protein